MSYKNIYRSDKEYINKILGIYTVNIKSVQK